MKSKGLKIVFILSFLPYLAIISSLMFGSYIMAKDSGMPIVWLCLGTTWLCISVEYKNKHRNSDKDRKR